jgi:histidinol phosphatase-like PHP family hydrolase
VKGYEALAITDHVDSSNVDFIVGRIVNISRKLNSAWKGIRVIPGVEITHAPLEEMEELIRYARLQGAKLILVHGESIAEPVLPGTNKRALESDIDILAHPGLITLGEARLAKKRGIYLEITTRRGHSLTNGHVAKMARTVGASLVLNTDSHTPGDLITKDEARRVAKGAGLTDKEIEGMFKNSLEILKSITY